MERDTKKREVVKRRLINDKFEWEKVALWEVIKKFDLLKAKYKNITIFPSFEIMLLYLIY